MWKAFNGRDWDEDNYKYVLRTDVRSTTSEKAYNVSSIEFGIGCCNILEPGLNYLCRLGPRQDQTYIFYLYIGPTWRIGTDVLYPMASISNLIMQPKSYSNHQREIFHNYSCCILEKNLNCMLKKSFFFFCRNSVEFDCMDFCTGRAVDRENIKGPDRARTELFELVCATRQDATR